MYICNFIRLPKYILYFLGFQIRAFLSSEFDIHLTVAGGEITFTCVGLYISYVGEGSTISLTY